MQPDLAGCQVDSLVVVTLQVDHPADAELRNRTAGLRVERDQPVARRHIDYPRLLAARRPAPVGQSAPRELSRCRLATRPFGQTVDPLQLAGRGVESHHRTPRPARRVQRAVDHERRGLEPIFWHRTEVVGLEPPGDLQVGEIVRGDLVERRIARMTQVASVGGPLAGGGARLGRDGRDRREKSRGQHAAGSERIVPGHERQYTREDGLHRWSPGPDQTQTPRAESSAPPGLLGPCGVWDCLGYLTGPTRRMCASGLLLLASATCCTRRRPNLTLASNPHRTETHSTPEPERHCPVKRSVNRTRSAILQP